MINKLCMALVLGAAALLAGCGGGGGNGDEPMDNGQSGSDPLAGVPTGTAQSSGAWLAYLKALVATSPQDREPVTLDGGAPPAEDAAEPQSLG